MGIRVHKQMGYGLCDLEHDEKGHKITDPRINTSSKLLTDPWSLKIEDYAAWLEARGTDDDQHQPPNMDRFVMRDMPDRKYEMQDTIAWQGEYGIASVLVLTPVSMSDWRRFDDAIDYVEETYLRDHAGPQANHYELLTHGIYPWNGVYIDTRTGDRLEESKATLWRRRYWSKEVTDEHRDAIAKALGFKDYLEASKIIAPMIPQEVCDLAEYGELFTNDTVWLQLRPMIYTYWA